MRLISAGSLVRVQSGPPFGVTGGLKEPLSIDHRTLIIFHLGGGEHAEYEFWLSGLLGFKTVQEKRRQFQFFEIYIQKVNLGQIMYNSLSCSMTNPAREKVKEKTFVIKLLSAIR